MRPGVGSCWRGTVGATRLTSRLPYLVAPHSLWKSKLTNWKAGERFSKLAAAAL